MFQVVVEVCGRAAVVVLLMVASLYPIVQTISPLVGDTGVSIEVFSDERTMAQEMFDQCREMFSWIPNAHIKYPCTAEGLRAA